ncbi:hypothetical protein GIB67_003487 [Kingdonia uniflora]|uniref:Plastid division protein CDP1-like IMS domain-containing protein n=1 Tax=Kingdonia uniflora TaxID=39325 RepID=A0A7J7MEL1_9MAGN|nr:hypothetical protein GIB67_003487 [Kingdonia uniflora]
MVSLRLPTKEYLILALRLILSYARRPPEIDQEIWLKDAVLGLFPDTRNCSPNLANFFQSEKRSLRASKQSKGAPRPFLNAHRSSSFVLPSNHSSPEESLSRLNSTGNLGVAVKQLAAAHLESPLANCPTPSIQLKRNLGMRHKNVWESFWFPFDIVGRISLATVVGCFVLINFRWHLTKPKVDISSLDWTMDMDHKVRTGNGLGPAFIGGRSIGGQLGKLLLMFKRLKLPPAERTIPNILPGEVLDKKPMPVEEAEALVKQWQTIKAEALGPDHQLQSLSEVLSESMLTQWEALAHSAKNKSCFWRFVLLQLSVLRADIMVDGSGGEMAEIEALLEEAAELVDESQHKNPNYYR